MRDSCHCDWNFNNIVKILILYSNLLHLSQCQNYSMCSFSRYNTLALSDDVNGENITTDNVH